MSDVEYGVVPGQIIAGKYRLVEPIGHGGMGSVWRATANASHPHVAAVDQAQGMADCAPPDRELVLKIILPRRLEAAPHARNNAIGRFMREARALMRLRSPHVVLIYDHGRDEEFVFIAMELLVGEPLSARLKRQRRLDVADTVRLFTHLGRAVSLAHKHGIVHRDLKPANIFLCRHPGGSEDVAKVLDFGLVKSVDVPLASMDVKTRGGAVLGTPYYMSPEQARGASDVDQRADLWALGVIAFECLCGVKPFRSKALAQLFAQIASGKAPVPSQVAEVPAGFDDWFLRAVRFEPAERFPSADAMIDDLREVLLDAAMSVRDARRRRVEGDEGTFTLADDELRTERVHSRGEATTFLGRDAELALLDRARDGGARVISLVGRAGVGKTRLAREAARNWQRQHKLSTWACWLDDVPGGPWAWLEIAAGLNMDGVGEPSADGVARSLRALGHGVVLFDGIDGVRAMLALALPGWLAAAPTVTFLVTGSEALGIPNEHVIDVAPLPPPIARIDSIPDLMKLPAAAVFMAHAVGRDRRFLAVDPKTTARLVAGLGGMPLGMAVATSLIDPTSIDSAARGLSAERQRPGGTTVIDPVAILDSTLGWVFRELSFAERSALGQLSVFRDGFTLDAAEEVIDGSWRLLKRPYEIVLDLTRKGLLFHHEPVTGEARFRMHPVLMQFCGRMLAEQPDGLAPEAREAAARHARYFARLGDGEAMRSQARRGGVVRRTHLQLEAGNLRVALAWSLRARDRSTLAALGRAVAVLFTTERMPVAAATTVLSVLDCTELGSPERLALQLVQGRALRIGERPELAWSALTEARQTAVGLADACGEAAALTELALTALAMSNAVEGHRLAVAALERAGDDPRCRADAFDAMGALALALDRPRDAELALREAVALHRASGDRKLEARTLLALGTLFAELDRTEEAGEVLRLSYTLLGELGNRVEQTLAIAWLGEIASRSDWRHAARLLERAAALARELGAADVEGRHLAHWALLLLENGERERAPRGVRRAEELLERTHDAEPVALLGICRAWMELHAERLTSARAELERAQTRAHASPLRPTSRVGRAFARLQQRLAS